MQTAAAGGEEEWNMDLNYYRQYEPIFGSWHIARLIGEGSFGKVFEIRREDFGQTYRAALKAITIPESASEVRSMLSEGMDKASVRASFQSTVEELVKEFALMSKLKGNSNVVSYENHQVIEHRDGIGWDILIQMELLTPLDEYLRQKKAVSQREVLQLGIDLCKALELCQKHNIIHRDIKPENTFVSENGDFKLGDFGTARTLERTTGGLSKKGTYAYMAPEVYKGEAYGPTVDLYSLGLILYRLLNGNRLPFLPAAPAPITYADRENAYAKRFSGAPLPPPAHAGGQLGAAVLKACAYRAKDRYASPSQMRQDLEAILLHSEEAPSAPRESSAAPDEVPPAVEPEVSQEESGTVSDFNSMREGGGTVSDFGSMREGGGTVSDFGSIREGGGTVSDSGSRVQSPEKNISASPEPAPPAQNNPARRKNGWKIAVAAACLAVLTAAGGVLLSQSGGSEPAPSVSVPSQSGSPSIAAGESYRVAFLGPYDGQSYSPSYVEDLLASLEEQLQTAAADAGATIQVDSFGHDPSYHLPESFEYLPSQGYDVLVSASDICAAPLAQACQETGTPVVYTAVTTSEARDLDGLSGVTGISYDRADSVFQAIMSLSPDAGNIGILNIGGTHSEVLLCEELITLLEQNGVGCTSYSIFNLLDANDASSAAQELAEVNEIDVLFTVLNDSYDYDRISAFSSFLSNQFVSYGIPVYTTNDVLLDSVFALIHTDYTAMGEQTANMVFQVLGDGELPAPQTAYSELIVNEQTAALLSIPVEGSEGLSLWSPDDVEVQ